MRGEERTDGITFFASVVCDIFHGSLCDHGVIMGRFYVFVTTFLSALLMAGHGFDSHDSEVAVLFFLRWRGSVSSSDNLLAEPACCRGCGRALKGEPSCAAISVQDWYGGGTVEGEVGGETVLAYYGWS